MRRAAGFLMMSLLFTVCGMSQTQLGMGNHPASSAAAVAGGKAPVMLLAEAGTPDALDRIVLPGMGPASRRPINLGWHAKMGARQSDDFPHATSSASCKNYAVNSCTSQCADIGECIFGCELGGIDNVDVCSSSCNTLGDSCLNSCVGTVNAINTSLPECSPLTVTKVEVMVGSSAYTIISAVSGGPSFGSGDNTSYAPNVLTSPPAVLPWTITGIRVTFSEPVMTGDINSLGGLTANAFSGLGTEVLTWTLAPTSMANVNFTLATSGDDVLSDAVTAGNPLQNSLPFTQALKVLAGDVNADGVVNASDVTLENNATSKPYNDLYDMNGDGAVTSSDVTAVRAKLNTKLPAPPPQ